MHANEHTQTPGGATDMNLKMTFRFLDVVGKEITKVEEFSLAEARAEFERLVDIRRYSWIAVKKKEYWDIQVIDEAERSVYYRLELKNG